MPERSASDLPWPGYRTAPQRLNLAREVLEQPIERGFGNRSALLGDDGAITYAALQRQVEELAGNLLDRGLGKGDLVLIRMGNSPEFAVSFLAAVKLGALPVLINSQSSAEELKTILEQCRPRLIMTQSSRAGALRELSGMTTLPRVISAGGSEHGETSLESLLQGGSARAATADTTSDEPAFIVYTSGTTGKPKGIVHAHRWIVALGDLNRHRLPPQADDVVLATGEWSFISALGHNLLFPLRNAVTGAVLSSRATPENVLAAIAKYRVTVLHSVATVYRRLLAMTGFENRYDLRSLRCAHSTGEALRDATYHEWKSRVGCELYEHYGVSEYQLVIGHGVRQPIKPGSVGVPLPGVDVAILDDGYRAVPTGTLGQFAISRRDPGLFLGYYNDPERTAAAIQNGWYFTGDLAWRDEDGYFFFAGRRDDCFKSRGIFISPTEVENALQKHPSVTEAAVVAEPDPEIGNRIRAVVVLHAPDQASEELAASIRGYLRTQLAPFKIPHVIEFANSLPKSAIGKILRKELVKPADAGRQIQGVES